MRPNKFNRHCVLCGALLFNRQKHAKYCRECAEKKREEGLLKSTLKRKEREKR